MSTTIVLIQIESWPFNTGIKIQDLLSKNIIMDYRLGEIVQSPLVSDEIKAVINPYHTVNNKVKKEAVIKQLYDNQLTPELLGIEDINSVRFRIDNTLYRFVQQLEKQYQISFELEQIEQSLSDKSLEELMSLAQTWWNTIEIPDSKQQVQFPKISQDMWEQEQEIGVDDISVWNILRSYIYWKKDFDHQPAPQFEALEAMKSIFNI